MLSTKILQKLEIYINSSISTANSLKTKSLNEITTFNEIEEIEESFCCSESCINYNYNELDVEFDDLEDFIEANQHSPFQEILFQYIDENNLKDNEVYKAAHIDRRLFSKIRCDKNYKPSKSTVISLGLALKLNKDNIKKLLESVGYTLSNSSISDLIICFSIEHKIFNIMQVNYALEKYNCITL